MMIKKLKIALLSISLFAIAVLVLMLTISFAGDKEVKYNNDNSISDIVTKTYSNYDIEKISESIENNNFDYATLKSNYNIQCLRKTHQGYYAVFLQDDGKRVFVFMNEKMKPYDILAIERIKEKKDYNFIVSGETTESEILKYDESAVLLPASAVTSTAHIVQEGLLIINYERFNEETATLLNDPIVKSVTFFSNDDLTSQDNLMINSNVPFILEIDKK